MVDTDQTDPQQDDVTSTVDAQPSLTIEKSLTNGDDAVVDTAGEVIEYTIVVANTGNVDLTGVVLTDAFAGGATLVSGDVNNNNILETTETWTWPTTPHPADLNAGRLERGRGRHRPTDPQQDDVTSTVDAQPSLSKSLTNGMMRWSIMVR
ncbi:MAG: DUF11 domain-containing protein [Caldilineaceae bacterium]